MKKDQNYVQITGWITEELKLNRKTFFSEIYESSIKLAWDKDTCFIPVSISDSICRVRDIVPGTAVEITGSISVGCIKAKEVRIIKEDMIQQKNTVILMGEVVKIQKKNGMQIFELGIRDITFIPVSVPCVITNEAARNISEHEKITVSGCLTVSDICCYEKDEGCFPFGIEIQKTEKTGEKDGK